jgi:hypothetical protein
MGAAEPGRGASGPLSRPFLSALFFLLFTASASCEVPTWLKPFFVEGGVQYYLVPDLLKDYLQPEPGFRGSLGYEWRRWRFSAESGFTRIIGTNPLVLDIAMTPILFKTGYTFPLLWGIGLKPELGMGLLYSRTGHYPTVIDMLLGNKQEPRTWSLFSAFRLDLCYTFPGDFIGLYAGGGVDMIIETGGPIPLPVFQAGLTLKPFALAARIASRRAARQAEEAAEPEEPEEMPGILRR